MMSSFGLLQQAAHDLDALAFADRKRVDMAVDVERQGVGVEDGGDLALERAPVERLVHADGDVLEHRHRLEEREVLEHHADAELARRARRLVTTTGAPSKRISPASACCTP